MDENLKGIMLNDTPNGRLPGLFCWRRAVQNGGWLSKMINCYAQRHSKRAVARFILLAQGCPEWRVAVQND
ncbi:MAG: hypothetical protein WCV67_20025 [Victivallaceae bacterium]|jgi:hypothetical protein